MTWIKICGTTNLEDAQMAVEAGADALGFVFYDKSPRKIEPELARQIVATLPPQIEKVGVFVDSFSRVPIDIFNDARLTAMQLHIDFQNVGNKSSDESKAYGLGCFWQPPHIYWSLSAAMLLASHEQGGTFNLRPPALHESGMEKAFRNFFGTIFLDSSTPEQPGGTGKTFDWEKAVPLVDGLQQQVKVVVAGGLTPANVAQAIRILKPWGVDVASGVEARPGKKDPEKVRAFIKAVRTAEKSN
jgi:phosphoribosylanthranilate isomerase